MKYLILFVVSFISCTITRDLNKLSPEIIDAKMDKLGQYYTVLDNGVVNMYNDELQLLHTFSSVQNTVTSIDVSNPQKILLYNGDLNNVVFLDNTLSVINNIALDDQKYLDIAAVGMSNDNNIWLWDASTTSLIKIDANNQELYRVDLLTLISITDVKTIQEEDNQIYIVTDDNLYIFSNLGILLNTISLTDVQGLNISSTYISYIKKGQVYVLNKPLYLPVKTNINVTVGPDDVKYFFSTQIKVTKSGFEKF